MVNNELDSVEEVLLSIGIHILILSVLVFDRYDREGGAQQAAQPLSDARASSGRMAERRCTLAQITDEGMGTNGQPAFVQVLLAHPRGNICSRHHVVEHKHADRCAYQTCREERLRLLALIEAKSECEVYWALPTRESALVVAYLMAVIPATYCMPCHCSACSRLFGLKQVWVLQKHCLCDSNAGAMPAGSHPHLSFAQSVNDWWPA